MNTDEIASLMKTLISKGFSSSDAVDIVCKMAKYEAPKPLIQLKLVKYDTESVEAETPEEETEEVKPKNYRTKMCRFGEKCNRKTRCLYAHSPEELRTSAGADALNIETETPEAKPKNYRTKMCRFGEKCNKKTRCLFAHSPEELNSSAAGAAADAEDETETA